MYHSTWSLCKISPAHKQRVIRVPRGKGHVVGFMGDGINDAPASRAADIGISVLHGYGHRQGVRGSWFWRWAYEAVIAKRGCPSFRPFHPTGREGVVPIMMQKLVILIAYFLQSFLNIRVGERQSVVQN